MYLLPAQLLGRGPTISITIRWKGFSMRGIRIISVLIPSISTPLIDLTLAPHILKHSRPVEPVQDLVLVLLTPKCPVAVHHGLTARLPTGTALGGPTAHMLPHCCYYRQGTTSCRGDHFGSRAELFLGLSALCHWPAPEFAPCRLNMLPVC